MSENRVHINYKDQLLNVVYGNNVYLLWATICETQINTLHGKMLIFVLLQQVVHTVTTMS